MIPEFGGLEINTSSTALQALTDAVIYLDEYPYDTPDGYASRMLAIASLRDVLDAFDAEGVPSRDELDARVVADIDALAALQNDDGGWSWWSRGLDVDPVADAPRRPRAGGRSRRRLLGARPTRSTGRSPTSPTSSRTSRPSTATTCASRCEAYAIHVRAMAGDRDVPKATQIYRTAGIALQLDAVAWLWPAIDDPEIRTEIERLFANRATETAGAATFATAYSEDAYVIAPSDRRTDGVILDALITQAPTSDLIPKVVAGLLGHQVRGRWNSAQDNAFILVALHHYFETFESVTPDVRRPGVARPARTSSEQAFDGRTTDRAATLVPMAELVGVGEGANVVLQKDGDGRLYYRLGLRYAPADLTLDARDEGFVVERTYEAIDDPADVQRDADGTWRIRAGRQRAGDAHDGGRRTAHPRGADRPAARRARARQPRARRVADVRARSDGRRRRRPLGPYDSWFCWCWNWYEHQNLRDDRVEAYTSYLEGGTYEYRYIARATTAGQFVVPPARAEELYAPEVFGRSAGDTVVIG